MRKFWSILFLILLACVFCSVASAYECENLSLANSVELALLRCELDSSEFSLNSVFESSYDDDLDSELYMWCVLHGHDPLTITANDVIVEMRKDTYSGGDIDLNRDYLDVCVCQILFRRWGLYEGDITGIADSELYYAITRFNTFDSDEVFEDDFGIEMTPEYDVIPEATYRYMLYEFDPLRGMTIGEYSYYTDIKRVERRLASIGYYHAPVMGTWSDELSSAILRFQGDNGISEAGVGMKTQSALFSEVCDPGIDTSKGYKLYVDTTENYVSVLGWANGGYTREVHHFICSCGKKDTPTIKGKFKLKERRGEWYKISSNGWVQYAYRFVGGYYFHSVLFAKKGDTKVRQNSDVLLGQNASHGCIRLSVEDCKWIYENCDIGTEVEIV